MSKPTCNICGQFLETVAQKFAGFCDKCCDDLLDLREKAKNYKTTPQDQDQQLKAAENFMEKTDKIPIASMDPLVAEARLAIRNFLEFYNAAVTYPDVVEVLEDVINQACTVGDELDSSALSAYAGGMRLLAKLGRLEITKEYGRRVIGKWVAE